MGRSAGIKTVNTDDDDLPWYTIGSSEQQKMQYRKAQADLEALENTRRAKQGLRPRTEAQDAYNRALNRASNKPLAPVAKPSGVRQNVVPGGDSRRRNVVPGMGSDQNINDINLEFRPNRYQGGSKPGEVQASVGKGKTEYFGPSAKAPRGSVAPRVASKPAGEYVAPSSPEAALTAGIPGLPGAQSGMAQEAGSEYGRTTYFGDTPETAVEVAQQMNAPQGRVQFEDETAKPFWSRFKKGGQVKKKPAKTTKKYASGGSVSSASKRGDGCAQRGKTKGRMV